ncbi:MAG: hypothetical protein E6612_05120, partial [Paeniclostridium sordellii]|nr:hypothetical protein [Paeniclostridium sordellii]
MVSAALAVFALSWLMAAAPAAARSREAGHLQAHAAPGPSRNEPAIATVPLPQPRPEAAPPRVRAGAGATDSAGAGGKAAAAKGEPGAARQAQEKAGNEAGTDAKSDVKSDANAGPRALQVPQPEAREIPGGRLIRKFPSDMTLWQVLRQFESGDASAGRNVNITARGVAGAVTSGAGQLYYEMPVLNIMGRELAAFQDFQKTLSQLGHNSGNVLVRLSYRKTDQTLFEAMEQISQFFKHTDEESKKEGTSAAAKDEPQQESTEQREDTPMADAAAQPPASSTESQAPLSQQQQPTDSSTTTGQSTPQDLTPSSDSSQSKDPYQPVSVFLAP